MMPDTISVNDAQKLGWGTSTNVSISKGGLPDIISADQAKQMGWNPPIQMTQNNTTSPLTDSGLGSLPVLKQLTQFGAGVGSAVGQAGINLGQTFLKGSQYLGNKILGTPKNVYTPEIAQMESVKQNVYEKPFAKELNSVSGQIGNAVGQTIPYLAPGATEEKLYQKGAEGASKIPGLLGMTNEAGQATKAGGILSNLAKVGLRGGITGVSTAGVATTQGENPKTAGIVGTIAGAGGQTFESFGKGLAESMQKSGFKLSPVQEAKVSAKADNAAKFMTENKILGSDETKYSKLSAFNNNMETALQSSLPKDVRVPKQNIIDNINSSVESLKTKDPAIYESAKRDADSAIKLLQSQKGESAFTKGGTVSVEDALNAKRSYGKQAFKQTKFTVKDPNVVSEGNYAVEQGFQNALSSTLDKTNSTIKVPAILQSAFGGAKEVTLPEFNKVYSNAITSKNLTNLARFKNDTGLIGRLFGLWAGEATGQVIAPGLPGKIIGGAVGEMASSRIPGVVRNVGERALSTSPNTIIGGAKAGLGILSKPNQ